MPSVWLAIVAFKLAPDVREEYGFTSIETGFNPKNGMNS